MARKKKKMFVRIATGAATIFVLLFLLILLAPRLVDMTSYKEKALAEISRAIQGKADFQDAELSFFPRPRLVILHGKISIPGEMDAAVQSLAIYPEILPLFMMDVRVYRLQVESPDITINQAEFPGKEKKGQAAPSEPVGKKLQSGLAYIASKVPGLVLAVKNGSLNFTKGNVPGFWFKNIQALVKCPPDRLDVDLKCESGFWKRIFLKGSLDPEKLDSFGHLEILNFQPRGITGHFFPSFEGYLGDSELNLNLDFKTDGSGFFEADVQGSIPLLTVYPGNRKLVIRGKRFKGAVYFSEQEQKVSLFELDLDDPRINLSGEFRADRKTPRASLEVIGRDVDVSPVRSAVTIFAGDIPIVRTILDIVRGGRAPEIRFHSRGKSLGDLGTLKNMVIAGNLNNGNIFVPTVELDLKAVSGEVTISNGILEGKNLNAVLGNSSGRDGTLKLGLDGEDPLFHLDVALDADLAQLPAILKRFVRDTSVPETVDLFEDVSGNAKGRLILGERLDSIKTKLEVSEFNLSARYRPLMYPLKIRSGQNAYDDGHQVVFKNLVGSLGASTFSGLYAGFDLREPLQLEVQSKASTLDVKEIYALLSSFETLKDSLKDYGTPSGTINVSSLALKGPLSEPAQWQFKTDGTVQGLVANVSRLNGPVTVIRGEFSATPERLSVKGVESKLPDASFVASGTIDGYMKGLRKADMAFQGEMGPEALQKISDLINLPPELGVRSPLTVSQSRITWDNGGPTAFTGVLAVKGGPEVSLDVNLDAGKLMVKDLHIRDKTSDTKMAMTVDDKTIGLDFKGNLNRSTLDGLLKQNRFLTGGIDGDFRVRILRDQPLRSWIWGKLHATGLEHPWQPEALVKIENVSLSSTENRLLVESILFTLGENSLSLGGTVEMDENGPRFDLDLSADGIEWENVLKLSGKEKKELEKTDRKSHWVRSLRGDVRIKSDYLTYDRFTWRPLHATLTFDGKGMGVDLTEAMICGVSTPGSLRLTPEQIQLDFKPMARNQEVESVLPCLWTKESVASGRFDFDGVLTAKGEQAHLERILRGNFQFSSYGGRIYKDIIMEKIFSLLNVANIIRGDFSAFSKQGFIYHSIKLDGEIENGKLVFNEIIMEAPSMNIVGQGELDIIEQKVDLRLLVNPLQKISLVIGKIPGIRLFTGDDLFSFPMKVTGNTANPNTSTIPVSEIESELVETMKNLLEEE
ncbi:MAG: AsmA-like C-terminal domain-containing protein [Pseudomonadota bacterium]